MWESARELAISGGLAGRAEEEEEEEEEPRWKGHSTRNGGSHCCVLCVGVGAEATPAGGVQIDAPGRGGC